MAQRDEHRAARPLRILRIGWICAALVLVAACHSGRPGQVDRSEAGVSSAQASRQACPISEDLVPACGALWGITTPAPTSGELKHAEHQVGRSFDFVYRFHDINDVIPTPEERNLVRDGKILHITIDSRDYADRDPTTVRWSDVADGRYDSELAAQARGIASLRAPVYLTFDHEPDQSVKRALGSGADYIRAWRHVYDLFHREGASNTVWVWVIMGWPPAFARASTMWPGNNYVDWISWEAYNQSGCQNGRLEASQFTSFTSAIKDTYHWVHSVGPTIGMDPTKPMMISEAGSVLYPDDPKRTADWYARIPQVLSEYPQIKAIGLWDHTGSAASCDFRFDANASVLAAVRTAGQQPWVTTNPHLALPPRTSG